MDDDLDALKREATQWIVRLTSGKATVEDAEALRVWRARSPQNERAFREASRLWRNIKPALQPASETTDRRQGSLFSRRAFMTGGGIAASAAGAAFVMAELGFIPSINDFLADYATGVGETRTVTLSDGSTAVLDGRTSLAVHYDSDVRRISLESGAAVFEVNDTDTRPFEVIASNGISRMSSGSLSIALALDDVSVICIYGHVDIECKASLTIGEGEGVIYSWGGIKERGTRDVATVAAWREGLLIFKDRPLGNVIADLNRHRRGKVVLARRALSSHHVSGVFHLDRPDEILAHFQDTLHLRSLSLMGGVIVLM